MFGSNSHPAHRSNYGAALPRRLARRRRRVPVKTCGLVVATEQTGPRCTGSDALVSQRTGMRKLVEKTQFSSTNLRLQTTVLVTTKKLTSMAPTTSGNPLVAGQVHPVLEAARENGTYKIHRKRLQWGPQPIEKTDLEG